MKICDNHFHPFSLGLDEDIESGVAQGHPSLQLGEPTDFLGDRTELKSALLLVSFESDSGNLSDMDSQRGFDQRATHSALI